MVSDRIKYQNILGVDQLSPSRDILDSTKYEQISKTFRHGPNVLWTKCLMNTLDRIKCLLTERRVWNLSHFQDHVLNPNSKLRLLSPSPFWFWPSKPSFIYLCKFVQTESNRATRADLPPNSTQVWQEPSYLMVQNVFTSAANPRSSGKPLKPQIISGSYSDQLSGWRRKQNRLHLESRTLSWPGLWTLSCMPSIYGNDIPTGKPGPLDGSAPGLVPRLSVA